MPFRADGTLLLAALEALLRQVLPRASSAERAASTNGAKTRPPSALPKAAAAGQTVIPAKSLNLIKLAKASSGATARAAGWPPPTLTCLRI